MKSLEGYEEKQLVTILRSWRNKVNSRGQHPQFRVFYRRKLGEEVVKHIIYVNECLGQKYVTKLNLVSFLIFSIRNDERICYAMDMYLQRFRIFTQIINSKSITMENLSISNKPKNYNFYFVQLTENVFERCTIMFPLRF